ncbi:MAG: hypothetical protein ACK4M3_07640, partial [Pyrobaculum sp.]
MQIVETFGGRREVNKIREWGLWFGARWWQMRKEARTPLVRALRVGLTAVGVIDGAGNLKKKPQQPQPPFNSYVAEHVEFLDIVDRAIETFDIDRNSVEIVLSGLQLQKWRLQVARWLLGQASPGQTAVEPLPGDGVLAAIATQEMSLRYIAYGPWVELAAAAAPEAKFHKATSACEIVERPDVAVLFEKLPWLVDPVRELWCLYRALRPGGLALVAEPEAASSPAYAGALAALGALRAVTRGDIEKFLNAAGFKLLGKPIDLPP